MVNLNIPQQLPLLERLCWNVANPYNLQPKAMLDIYQSRWKYGNLGIPTKQELEYIARLTKIFNAPPLMEKNQNKAEFFATVNTVLNEIDSEVLNRFNLLWCGGSLLAAENDRYRLSLDLDFIANAEDYDCFYEWLLDRQPQTIFKPNSSVTLDRVRRDRIGIRIPAIVGDRAIKIEFIAEERFTIDVPMQIPNRVGKLSFIDCVVSKLFANRDRWIDGSSYCRDLIDLAMLRKKRFFPEAVYTKGRRNYKIKQSLSEALVRFQNSSKIRQECYEKLQIDRPQLIIDGIDLLAQDFELPMTLREFNETDFSYLEPEPPEIEL